MEPRDAANRSLRFLSPNGHLGFAPTRTGSFEIGLQSNPHFICADSGSNDVGPGSLGSDTSTSPLRWQTHDLEVMLLASRRLGVPMIVGSAGDSGSNSRVDMFVAIVKDLARKHGLGRFKVGFFHSEISKDYLEKKIERGDAIIGLDGRADLTAEVLDETDRVVGMAGIQPYVALLDQGAQVIIGGRSSDCAMFAAPAVRDGYPEALAYYLGKVLECASFCAEPYGGKETVMGEITMDDVKVTAMHPDQRCTIASVAGHAMYERSNPYFEHFVGGAIDMGECRYEQFSEKTARIIGPRFVPAEEIRVKLEGSGKEGERFIGIAGVRDPYTIANIDAVIAWATEQVRDRFGDRGYALHYHVFGRNGVMGELEPLKDRPGHELCIVVQGVAPSKEMAEEVCMIGTRQLFYARLPAVKGTAGGVAFLLEEVLPASPAFRWTLNHTVRVDDPMELFPTFMTEAGN